MFELLPRCHYTYNLLMQVFPSPRWPSLPYAGVENFVSEVLPMPKTYRACIIGRTGRGNYGHNLDTAWRTHPRAEIVGVADGSPEGLKKTGERLSATRFIRTIAACLAS